MGCWNDIRRKFLHTYLPVILQNSMKSLKRNGEVLIEWQHFSQETQYSVLFLIVVPSICTCIAVSADLCRIYVGNSSLRSGQTKSLNAMCPDRFLKNNLHKKEQEILCVCVWRVWVVGWERRAGVRSMFRNVWFDANVLRIVSTCTTNETKNAILGTTKGCLEIFKGYCLEAGRCTGWKLLP